MIDRHGNSNLRSNTRQFYYPVGTVSESSDASVMERTSLGSECGRRKERREKGKGRREKEKGRREKVKREGKGEEEGEGESGRGGKGGC